MSDLRRNNNCRYIPVADGSLRFIINYPLTKEYIGAVTLKPKNGEIIIGELCWLVAQAYKKIYATAVMKKVGKARPGTAFCDNSMSVGKKNPWGIWGHSIDDLWIEGFVWRPKEKMFDVLMGS